MIVAFDGRKYDASECVLNPLKTREREELGRPKKRELQ